VKRRASRSVGVVPEFIGGATTEWTRRENVLVLGGKHYSVLTSRPYGCSVKYSGGGVFLCRMQGLSTT
jgi:hypothetical protein